MNDDYRQWLLDKARERVAQAQAGEAIKVGDSTVAPVDVMAYNVGALCATVTALCDLLETPRARRRG